MTLRSHFTRATALASLISLATTASAQVYTYDDGSTENALNIIGASEIGFLHGFDAGPGGDVVSEVHFAIGTALDTAGDLDGRRVFVAVWEDPNDDGDPSDAVPIHVSPMLTASQTNTDTKVAYQVTPGASVVGVFFVGVWTEAVSSEFPVGLDISGGGQGHPAFIFWDASAVDPSALSGLAEQTNAVFLLDAYGGGTSTLGMDYCTPAVPNSTGNAARISGIGSPQVSSNQLLLRVEDLPPNTFGYCIASETQAFIPNPAGSQGNLCLGGAIGRFITQIQNSGPAGTFDVSVDLTAMPQPNGLVAVQPGETWNFQAWYRDANPGTTSNFTQGYSIDFI